MKLQEVKEALEKTGYFLRQWTTERVNGNHTDPVFIRFSELVSQQHALNNWHSGEDIIAMLDHLGRLLSLENLNQWMSRYPGLSGINTPGLPVLVKPNINYAFAGIQEWLCCMITQSPFVLTATENQFHILKFLAELLVNENEGFIKLLDIHPKNSLKYQQYIIHAEKMNDSMLQYFSTKKALIIEPKNSVAIITGIETDEDLQDLGKDIFTHPGQSPRTLRKLYIPENYDIRRIIMALEPFSGVYRNNKYANNYDYHQSVYLMNKIPFLDNGFLIFKEDASDAAPAGCLFYEYYTSLEPVLNKLSESSVIENIICAGSLAVNTVRPGESHFFKLWDYLNGKDLVQFLLE